MRKMRQFGFGGRQAGFTIIELMVALVIGLVIMVGAIQLFLVSKSSFNRVGDLAERQESLRFVVDSISRDVRTARFNGIYVDNDNKTLRIEISPLDESNPYCGVGDNFLVVVYDSQDGFRTAHGCSASSFNNALLNLGALEQVVGGVDQVEFFGSSVGSQVLFVDVEINFSAFANEPEGSNVFSFVVTNRDKALVEVAKK